MTVYLQQSWPKQTETNRQIKDINAALGSAFKTWDDVAARGSMVPSTVKADTDSTGPNVWLGIGRRF